MSNTEESYEIEGEDREMHAISVIFRALNRHIGKVNENPTSDERQAQIKSAKIRCLKYVLDRISEG